KVNEYHFDYELSDGPKMSVPENVLTTGDTDPLYDYVAQIDGTSKTAFLHRAYGPHMMAVTANATTGRARALETTLPVGEKWGGGDFTPNTFYWYFADLNGDGNAEALQVPLIGGTPKVAFNT